jgi:hypothetical protein
VTVQRFDKDGRIIVIARGGRVSAQLFRVLDSINVLDIRVLYRSA